jgi:hypothetical protein
MVDILAVARHCYTDQTVTEAYQNKNISNWIWGVRIYYLEKIN